MTNINLNHYPNLALFQILKKQLTPIFLSLGIISIPINPNLMSQNISNNGSCAQGDCQNGFGTFIWQDNHKYTGNWQDGLRHGRGKYEWSENKFYDGNWKQNLQHGFGKMFWPNNDSYSGNWQYGKMEGKGDYLYHDGAKYSGMFKDNFPHGQGTLFDGSGKIKYSGIWFEGQPAK